MKISTTIIYKIKKRQLKWYGYEWERNAFPADYKMDTKDEKEERQAEINMVERNKQRETCNQETVKAEKAGNQESEGVKLKIEMYAQR